MPEQKRQNLHENVLKTVSLQPLIVSMVGRDLKRKHGFYTTELDRK